MFCSETHLLSQQLFLVSSARYYMSIIMYAMINSHFHFEECSLWLPTVCGRLICWHSVLWLGRAANVGTLSFLSLNVCVVVYSYVIP